ncbi:hypothetical protein IF1G_00179 [Cordyceps javanica]|uniref:Uncharacterized protein n=1 Tax=Cordyceps javanica TaxID=43265 RepID=A0A545VET9_9HYPO|nr:hypothetical protein IF1G_00179 [Cordyceps javanica]
MCDCGWLFIAHRLVQICSGGKSNNLKTMAISPAVDKYHVWQSPVSNRHIGQDHITFAAIHNSPSVLSSLLLSDLYQKPRANEGIGKSCHSLVISTDDKVPYYLGCDVAESVRQKADRQPDWVLA